MNKGSKVTRYNGLQCLRVVAALSVVLSHFSGNVAAAFGPGHRIWFSGGKAGVDIFFVVSGFVMLYTSEGLTGKADGWKTFARRRLVRIAPLYWLATAFLLAVMLALPNLFRRPASSATYILRSFLFLPARTSDGLVVPLLAVGWTLNFEMFFYAVFCLVLFLRKNPLRWVSIAMIVVAASSLLPLPQTSAFAFYSSPIVLDFVAGMLIAEAMTRGVRLPIPLAMPLAVGSAMILGSTFSRTAWQEFYTSGLPAMLLVYTVGCMESLFEKLPAFLLLLADASYAMYLFHIFVLDAARVRLRTLAWIPLSLTYLVVTVGVIVVSVLIRRYVESPLLRRLNSIFSTGATDVRRSGNRVASQS